MTKTLDLTLEERAKFESLLTEHANAWMDVVRATERRHKALHAVNDYVNHRTGRLASDAYHEGLYENRAPLPPIVPMGTQQDCTDVLTDEEIAAGTAHARGPWVPLKGCGCSTCCEYRALAGIGTTTEVAFTPDPATSGGN